MNWYGTRREWDMLSFEEKQLYGIVCLQDDIGFYESVEPVKIRPRICSQCGAPIKAYGDYCEYCGVRIE